MGGGPRGETSERGGVGVKGVADHGKNTIPGPSIALVPPHFTRTPTLCAPLVTDPRNPLLIPPFELVSLSGLQMYTPTPAPPETSTL